MKFKNYNEFLINLKTDLLLQKFAPYTRDQLLALIKVSLDKNIDIDVLYNEIIEKKLSYELFLEYLKEK
jgi:hypothetical protein